MSTRNSLGRAFSLGFPLALGLAAAPALAQTPNYEIETATGVICDTSAQAERFALLYAGKAQDAIRQVNVEVGNDKACALARFEFIRGDKISTARSREDAHDIVRVLVIGLETPQGMRRGRPMEQFTPIKLDEVAV